MTGDDGAEPEAPCTPPWGVLWVAPKVTVRRTFESEMCPRAVLVRHGFHAAAAPAAAPDVGVGGARRHGSDGGSWAGATTGAGTALSRCGADIARSLTQHKKERKKENGQTKCFLFPFSFRKKRGERKRWRLCARNTHGKGETAKGVGGEKTTWTGRRVALSTSWQPRSCL